MKKEWSISKGLLILFILTTILFIVLWQRSSKKANIAENNLSAIGDTLKVYKNANGDQEGKIQAFEFQHLSDLLKIESSDSTINRLQAVVKGNKKASSVTVIGTETNINTSTPTTIEKVDTVNNNLYPTYHTSLNMSGWVVGEIRASKDSIQTKLKIKDEYDVVLKREKGKLQAVVITHNPYNQLKEVRAASVAEPRQKRFGIGPSAGVTWYNNKIQPYIGLGLHFNLIRF